MVGLRVILYKTQQVSSPLSVLIICCSLYALVFISLYIALMLGLENGKVVFLDLIKALGQVNVHIGMDPIKILLMEEEREVSSPDSLPQCCFCECPLSPNNAFL